MPTRTLSKRRRRSGASSARRCTATEQNLQSSRQLPSMCLESSLDLKDSLGCSSKDGLSDTLPSSATEWGHFTRNVRGKRSKCPIRNTSCPFSMFFHGVKGRTIDHASRMKFRSCFGIVYSFSIVTSFQVSGIDREITRLTSGRTCIIHWSICMDAHSYIPAFPR